MLELSPEQNKAVESAAKAGVTWLLGLQNRDGGWPTFCRGWTKLPFDRSGADITAHVLRAIHLWRDRLGRAEKPFSKQIDGAIARGLPYLRSVQQPDGSWRPLWFGNQDDPDESNPIYGTSRVMVALDELGLAQSPAAQVGRAYLLKRQNPDGGFGGGPSATALAESVCDRKPFSQHPIHQDAIGQNRPITSTIEETAQAIDGLAHAIADPAIGAATVRALTFLTDAFDKGEFSRASPIGFYFAKLWYYEDLYPYVYGVAALTRLMHHQSQPRSNGRCS